MLAICMFALLFQRAGCLDWLFRVVEQHKHPIQTTNEEKRLPTKISGRRSRCLKEQRKPKIMRDAGARRRAPCRACGAAAAFGTCGRLRWPSSSPACALPARPECVAPPRRARHRDVRRALQPLSVVVRRCLLVRAPSHHHSARREIPRAFLRVLGCW